MGDVIGKREGDVGVYTEGIVMVGTGPSSSMCSWMVKMGCHSSQFLNGTTLLDMLETYYGSFNTWDIPHCTR